MYYDVTAESTDFEMNDCIEAKDFVELAQFIRETIAYYRDNVSDTSVTDCSYVVFKYLQVLDENGNDVTNIAIEYM
jgi:hypothetical protein